MAAVLASRQVGLSLPVNLGPTWIRGLLRHHPECNAARQRLVYSRVAKPPSLLYIDYRGEDLPPVATILPTYHTVPYSTPRVASHIPLLPCYTLRCAINRSTPLSPPFHEPRMKFAVLWSYQRLYASDLTPICDYFNKSVLSCKSTISSHTTCTTWTKKAFY